LDWLKGERLLEMSRSAVPRDGFELARRDMTKGQKAIALAMHYPHSTEAKGGRGKKSESITGGSLALTRAVTPSGLSATVTPSNDSSSQRLAASEVKSVVLALPPIVLACAAAGQCWT
jgi:hypothetical protein